MDEIGIWPRFAGRGMHDRLASYDAYDCAHSICGAHLVRDCAGVGEQEHQQWAVEMQDFLLDLHEACQEWRLLHLTAVPAIERDEWVARYFEILAAGYAAQPPPPTSSAGSRKGRRKQSKAKNLLDALDGACRSSAGFARRPADAFYEQPGRAGPSLGESSAKDFWHLSQCDRGHRFLPHPQLSFDDAQARTLHALGSDCCLPWSPFTGRLGT